MKQHPQTPHPRQPLQARHGATVDAAAAEVGVRRELAPWRRRAPLLAAAVATAALLGACATTGMGDGQLAQKGKTDEPVLFSWKSTDGGISGTMVATLPNATYQGKFFQITQQTQSQTLGPLWTGWSPGWHDWPYWGGYGRYGAFGPDDLSQFVTRYTGKVVANLDAPSGQKMRCRLHMASPASGMAGGGDGECQIAGGGTIQARF